jgi:uncharacterized membrane protein
MTYYSPKLFPGITKTFLPGALLLGAGVVSLAVSLVNERGAGRFTPEGRLYTMQWENFRRYLTDFSALKEHPPESIKLWDRYMVYAVALGVAQEVIKNMSRLLPGPMFESSNFYLLRDHPWVFYDLSWAFWMSNPALDLATEAINMGVGGIGGGFGGGGGGAR